jgi:mannose-6-phosphate isomerase
MADRRPVIEAFQPCELGPKSWGRELLVAQTDSYIGKVLWMRAGASGPFQYHERKDETFFLFSGEAVVEFEAPDDGNPTLIVRKRHLMQPGESYHVPPGAVHRVEALADSVFFEASNPVFDDRVAVK